MTDSQVARRYVWLIIPTRRSREAGALGKIHESTPRTQARGRSGRTATQAASRAYASHKRATRNPVT